MKEAFCLDCKRRTFQARILSEDGRCHGCKGHNLYAEQDFIRRLAANAMEEWNQSIGISFMRTNQATWN